MKPTNPNELHLQSIEIALAKRNAELTLLSSIQSALTAQKEMPLIFNLVGDQLKAMFESYVVSIATFDQETEQNFGNRDERICN